jgi:hypothetical protein
MKRLVSFVSCLLLAAGSLVAQNPQSDSSVHFGIKGGVCLANQKMTYQYLDGGTRTVDTKYRTGFDAGVYVEIPIINPSLAGMMEIHYIQKGMLDKSTVSEANTPEQIGTLRITHETDYLSIPFLLKWRIPIGRITPYVLAGPRIDFFLRKKVVIEFHPPSENSFEGVTWLGDYYGLDFQKLDAGATAGLGFEAILKGDLSILLEFKYDYSFTNIVKTENLTIYNRSFQILAGIRLPMRGIGVKVNAEKDRESF